MSLYEGSSGRLRFHGVRREWIRAQAEALGLEPRLEASGSDGFEAAFHRVLEALEREGVGGVVFGNIHLADVRAWYESRTVARGFEHVEPLWGWDPFRAARAFAESGHRALVVSVNLELGDPAWLGEELSTDLVERMASAGGDPCGERGEYHSFVFAGPRFRHPVRFRPGEAREREGHRYLDLLPPRRGPACGPP